MTKREHILLHVLSFAIGVTVTIVALNYRQQKQMEADCIELGGTPAKSLKGEFSCIFGKNLV